MTKRAIVLLLTCTAAIALIAGSYGVSQSWLGNVIAQRLPWTHREFPAVAMAHLSDRQRAVIEVLRREFDANPSGTKYSEGIREPWCGDFVSWVMREAGQPLANPNSGHWRIPGVYTLTEYFQSQGRFEPAAGSYVPKAGDVVLYSENWRFGQHTNLVVAVSGDSLITVGGNEGGVNRGDVSRNDKEIVGFGVL